MPGPAEMPSARRPDIPQGLPEAARGIGLIELSQQEVDRRFQDIVQRTKIGLNRIEEPQMVDGGMASDGGFASFRTGIPLVNDEAWRQVPLNAETYVASLGGTNTKFYKATKESPTVIRKDLLEEKAYAEEEKKHMTYAEYIRMIVDPIATDYLDKPRKGNLRVAVSLAFPHKNTIAPNGVDAEFVPEKADGTLPKNWKITDWSEIPEEKRGFFGALKEAFAERGIENFEIAVVVNDTPGTALDSSAARKATADGKKVLEMGAVGGTGTNIAVNHSGLVNLEVGRGPLLADDNESNAVTERVIDNIKRDNPKEPRKKPEVELETGGLYIPERLKAGIELLAEKGLIQDAARITDLIQTGSRSDATFISKLATGDVYINDTVQYLAQGVLRRAGQQFGIANAAVAEAVYGSRRDELPAGLLVEGSFVNHGATVKANAELTAASLGQPFTIYEADSIKGVAALAMSWDYMQN